VPRYHFNIFHDRVYWDDVGEELPDQDAAWVEATRTAGEMIKNLDGKLKPGRDWRMEVTDEFQNPLWEIRVNAEKR